MQWTGNFSSDADAGECWEKWFEVYRGFVGADERVFLGVIQDAKFKRREALADLSKAAQGKGQGKNE